MSTPSTPRGVTEIDVWQAADALLLEGARPTIERVRQKIGRGSPNTVSPYLDTWFKKLGARIKDPLAFSAPPAIPDPVQQAATHFWEVALATARAEITAELAAERAALEAERSALTEEGQQLAARAEKLSAQLQVKDEAMQLARTHLSETKHREDTLEAELLKYGGEITALREQLAGVAADRDALRSQIDVERARHEASRAEIDARTVAHDHRWALEVDRARDAMKVAQTKLARLEKEAAVRVDRDGRELAQALKDLQRLERQYAASQSELERWRDEGKATLAALAELRKTAAKREATLQAQSERLQAQLSETLAQLSAKDQEHGTLLRSLVSSAKLKALPTPPKRVRKGG